MNTTTNTTNTIADLEAEALRARKAAEEATGRLRAAEMTRQRDAAERFKREAEAAEQARHEREEALRPVMPADVAGFLSGLVAVRDRLRSAPWPPGRQSPAFRALDLCETLIAGIEDGESVRHAEEIKRAALAANPAPVRVKLPATRTSRTDRLVVAGGTLANGGVPWDGDGVRRVLVASGLVCFATAEQAEAIERARAAHVDYLRASFFAGRGLSADEMRRTFPAGEVERVEREADEAIGFVAAAEDADNVLALALRWSQRRWLSTDDAVFAEFVKGCTCDRTRVRWAERAEQAGRSVKVLAAWLDLHREEAREAAAFWSDAKTSE